MFGTSPVKDSFRYIEGTWIDCKKCHPPKNAKFLYKYHYGIGLGQWGKCYTTVNGNSERTHESYILVLHPAELLDHGHPFEWNEEKMVEMEVLWRPLPK